MKRFFTPGLLLLLVTAVIPADGPAWNLVIEEEGIRVYQRKIKDKPVYEFKGTVVINAPVLHIAALALDYENYQKWQPSILQFKRLQTTTPYRFMNYFAVDLPWPVNDRDFISKNILSVDAHKKWLHLTWTNAKHRSMPVRKGFIRVPYSSGKWSLKSIKDGKATWAEFRSAGDPGGAIPSWLINWVGKYQIVDGVKRIRKRIRAKKYDLRVLKKYPEIEKAFKI